MGFVILSNEEGFSGYGVRKCFRKWKRSGVKLYILQDTCRFIVNFFLLFYRAREIGLSIFISSIAR